METAPQAQPARRRLTRHGDLQPQARQPALPDAIPLNFLEPDNPCVESLLPPAQAAT